MYFELYIAVLATVFGIIFITKGANLSTDSLIPVARKLGTTHVAVAIVIVSIIISLPEIFVALYSVLLGHVEISLGVVIGSVICNIGLMIGLSALIKPLKVNKQIVLRDGIFAVSVAIMVLVLSADAQITRAEGAAFVLMFIPYLVNVWEQEKDKHKAALQKDLEEVEKELDLTIFGRAKAGVTTFILGMVTLLFGSFMFSWALVQMASLSGVSDLIIGLTIGAIGPSIPNIASAVQGTIKGIEDVAISETLGSDIFTLLITLGILSLVHPIKLNQGWLFFDIPVMVFMSITLLFFMISRKFISRAEGGFLVFFYIGVLIINITSRA